MNMNFVLRIFKRRNGPKGGFTLTELIIYVALVGILMTAAGIFARDVILGSVKARANATVQSEARLALEKMRQEVLKAKSIDSLVLLATGESNSNDYDPFAEVYDLAAGTWSLTGSLAVGRQNHTSSLLRNGKVLIAGGLYMTGFVKTPTAELYNSAAGTWSTTGSLSTARDRHTATVLPDGRVLVAGGFGGSTLRSTELYNSTTGLWAAGTNMNATRGAHSATLLNDGTVLVAGGSAGSYIATSELYNPSTNAWTYTTGSLSTARAGHTATLLQDGRVLVVGGNNSGGALSSAETYNPATGTWSTTGSLTIARSAHTATLLPDGRVLVAGGFDTGSSALNSVELYNPSTGLWSAASPMSTTHHSHTAMLLVGGKVLIAGGYSATTELYDSSSGLWSTTGPLSGVRRNHTTALVSPCRFLFSDNTTHLSFKINGNSASVNTLQLCTKTGSSCSATDTWTNMTSPNVEVTDLSCANISSGTSLGEETVQIQMTVKTTNPSGKKDFDASTTVQMTVALRL